MEGPLTINPPHILNHPDQVFREAARQMTRIAREALRERETFRFVLAGGATPKGLYSLLARDPNEEYWLKTHFFFGDERAVPPDHPESNYQMAKECLLTPLGIPAHFIHRMEAEDPDLDGAASRYEADIQRHFTPSSVEGPTTPTRGATPAGGATPARGATPPAFDLVLLGMGADGHTASLFPEAGAASAAAPTRGATPAGGAATWQETHRWVVPVTSRHGNRLTLTPCIINQARFIIFLVVGQDKAPALSQVFEGAPPATALPCQQIRPQHGQCLWLVDRAAAHDLRHRG